MAAAAAAGDAKTTDAGAAADATTADGVWSGAVIEPRRDVPRRFQRAETVLQYRTNRLVLVLDSLVDDLNTQACLRTAEALGVQHVWVIAAAGAVKNTNAAATAAGVVAVPPPAAAAGADADAKAAPSSASAAAAVAGTGGASGTRTRGRTNPAAIAAEAAAASARGTLSNRQRKKIMQKSYHAGMAAAEKAGGGDLNSAAASAAREAAVKAAAEAASKELNAKNAELRKQFATPSKLSKAAKAAAYAAAAAKKDPTDAAAAAAQAPGAAMHIARGIVKGAAQWLSVRRFENAQHCIAALKADGRVIWSTNLSERAVQLDLNFAATLAAERNQHAPASGADAKTASDDDDGVLPAKLAVVIGREADGVSQEMLDASQRHIFLPMYGFTESFNVSVACALLLQRLFDLCPQMRGDLVRGAPDQAGVVRDRWFNRLVDKSHVSTVRWSEQAWARDFVPASYTQPNTVPVYRITTPTPLTQPIPTLADLRPPDADKVPRVAPKMRRKMDAASQRAVKTFGGTGAAAAAGAGAAAPPAAPPPAGAATK